MRIKFSGIELVRKRGARKFDRFNEIKMQCK